ncbi:membrane lipoprotein lipid attachment site-containing protein [Nitratireductor sp. OM-1]|uniref:membrane lipoprotein lipid attachment site-containing protein n=1 Tax=Nitratireductor sp. OM-1 TaxID=1756988 RepID=UPI0013AF95E9|nr:membrane lipoprotein lipid attachment site-containing protein [Nitratireductor sp. OM-1]
MKKLIFPLVAVLTLTACQMTGGTVYDKHTGKTIVHSRSVNVKPGLLSNMDVTAGYSDRNGYGVQIDYTSYDWHFFRQVWSFGKKYKYVVAREDAVMCGGAGGCLNLEKGAIRIPESDFRRFAKTGFEFKLIGTRGSVEAKIPASLFQEVLERQGK